MSHVTATFLSSMYWSQGLCFFFLLNWSHLFFFVKGSSNGKFHKNIMWMFLGCLHLQFGKMLNFSYRNSFGSGSVWVCNNKIGLQKLMFFAWMNRLNQAERISKNDQKFNASSQMKMNDGTTSRYTHNPCVGI